MNRVPNHCFEATATGTRVATRHAWRSRLLTALATFGIALSASTALAQSAPAAPQAKPPFPSITLPERAQGERDIALLGDRLPDVAAWYGMSVSQFASMLRTDRTVWIDRRGRVFYEEEVRLPPQGSAAPDATDPNASRRKPSCRTAGPGGAGRTNSGAPSTDRSAS